MADIKEEIRQYILSEFLPGEKASNLQDDTPLRTSGIMDSVGTLRFVGFLEERYGIELEAHDLGVESFDRIDSIVSLVESKVSAAS